MGQTYSIRARLLLYAALLGTALVAMWVLELFDLLFFSGGLDAYGIQPRQYEGLTGILLAPVLHGGFGHLASNTIPLLALGFIVLLHTLREFLVTTALAVLVGGAGVWLLGGTGTVHIGASGLIFGYLGYLLLRGYFRRSVGSIILSVVVAASYGWLLVGVLPFASGISWQAHLFGFLGGALSAYLLRGRRPSDEAADVGARGLAPSGYRPGYYRVRQKP